MFMVLTVHADFLAFGVPNYEEISAAPWSAIGRTFIEAAAVIGVNIFVMISGWFGIKPSVKGFCNFCFQVIYFYTLSLVITRLLGLNSISATNLAHIICLPENGWFIISYMGLYVLAPVLNVFLDTSSKRVQANVLISFFTIQTVYGFIGNLKILSSDIRLFHSSDFICWQALSVVIRRISAPNSGGQYAMYQSLA